MKSNENLNPFEQNPLDKNVSRAKVSSLNNSNLIHCFNDSASIYTIDVGRTCWNMEQLKKYHIK